MTMKAIETVYNGYRFRSRLEARWAVFFDTLGIRYEYEPEGFELGDAGRYLPDVWLPDHNTWLEIKPDVYDRGVIVDERLLAFQDALDQEARASNGEERLKFYILAGSPFVGSYKVCPVRRVFNEATEEYENNHFEACENLAWTICPLCMRFDIRHYDPDGYVGTGDLLNCEYCDIIDRSWQETEEAWFHKGHVVCSVRGYFWRSFDDAYMAARQARFEHGESGL